MSETVVPIRPVAPEPTAPAPRQPGPVPAPVTQPAVPIGPDTQGK